MRRNQNILILFFVFILSTSLLAQDHKQITLEDIWKKHTFSPESVYGIRSMNDGEHYCIINDDD